MPVNHLMGTCSNGDVLVGAGAAEDDTWADGTAPGWLPLLGFARTASKT